MDAFSDIILYIVLLVVRVLFITLTRPARVLFITHAHRFARDATLMSHITETTHIWHDRVFFAVTSFTYLVVAYI